MEAQSPPTLEKITSKQNNLLVQGSRDVSSDLSPVVHLIQLLSEVTDTPENDIETVLDGTLYDYVDGDAFNQIVTNTPETHVTIELPTHTVHAHNHTLTLYE